MSRQRFLSSMAALLALVALVAAACGGDDARPSTATSGGALVGVGAGLQGPEGLSATVYGIGMGNVAALAFDGSGRLWAATSAFADSGQDVIYVVEPGKSAQLVITGLHTPLGLAWIGGELFVSSKERVEEYSGFDGAAFASHRTVVSFPEGVGEVNGIAVGPDGRLYVGISSPCDHCEPELALSGSVVSFRSDGSDVRLEASGIRAPIGLAFAPGTSDLFVTMNQRDDLGDATPGDWLSLVTGGQDWGFPGCYGQGGTACEGAPTPIATLDQHAAVSGLAFVSAMFPSRLKGSVVVAEWATGKVLLVPVSHEGTGYHAAPPTAFLTGIEKPVAVITGPDGALYVGDWGTGTIYRIAAT